MSYLFAILIFSFLIFIHEFGHFVAAKAFGVQVNEFSLFMGPVLWKKQIGETQYSIRWIPIGGFCAMEGEDSNEETDNPHSFQHASWWKKIVILCAGVFMNLLTGIALLGIFFAPDEAFVVPVISQVEQGCAFAGENGIQAGDRFISLDGEKIYVYNDFSMLLSLNGGEVHDLVLERNGEKITLNGLRMEKREFPNDDGSTSLRYGFSFSVVPASFGETLKYVYNSARDILRLVRLSLGMLFSGKAGVQDVSGPVGIVQQMAEVADASGSMYYAFLNLVYFGAVIAINLAVMNLLPLPALDGGRIVGVLLTVIIEGVTRKKLDPKYESYVHGVGMIVLMALMVLIVLKDILFVVKR